MTTDKSKKQNNVSKQYYSLPEEKMQALIRDAQKGHTPSQEKLLEVFAPYFNKYFMLLFYQKIDYSFYDIRRFVNLFVPDKSLNYYLVRNQLNRDGLSKVNDYMHRILGMVNRLSTEEDIMQTLHMTFLQSIERYSPSYRDIEGRRFPNGKKTFQLGKMIAVYDEDGESVLDKDGEQVREIEINPFTGKPFTEADGILIPFSGYIYSYYYYLLAKNVKQLHIGQLGAHTFSLMATESSDPDAPSTEIDPADPELTEDRLGPEFIDEHWVIGETCGPPFDKLTIKERQLIKWKYVDGLKASEIKRRITEHPNTTRESINKIKSTIRNSLADEE